MNWRSAVVLAATLAVAGAARADDAAPFGSFVSPVSNPTLFEDPRITTELRPIYVYHDIDKNFVTGGGHAQIGAAQLRIGLNDRWGLIVTKAWSVWLSPKNGPFEQGWANIAAGLKHALYYDPARNTIVSIGLRFEFASGDHNVLQGLGQGVFNPFVTAATGVDKLHLLAYVGTRLPISARDTTFFDGSLHADYQLEKFYPLFELNAVQVIDSGNRLPIDQEGFDFFNLGARYASGAVVTAAFGARYRALEDLNLWRGYKGGLDLGATYEFPLTSRQDLFGWRVTSDAIFWVR